MGQPKRSWIEGKVVRAYHQHCVDGQRVAAAAQRRLDRVKEREAKLRRACRQQRCVKLVLGNL